jgi:hypothetical protein
MGSMIGSGDINWPVTTIERLGTQLALFRTFAHDESHIQNFAIHFMHSGNDYDSITSDVMSQVFQPLARDLKRHILRELERAPSIPVPASDRVVRLDHNAAAYAAVTEALGKVEEAVKATNDYPDAEDKEQRIAEISAGRRLLESTRVRVVAITAVLGPALRWLAEKFGGSIVGQIAATAWKLLSGLLGI